MKKKEKFITSHRERVKKAEMRRRESPEKISIFDREAFVEFYLLEDIVRLYEYRQQKELTKVVTTRAGEIAKKRNIEKFSAIINIFKSAIEIAWGEIDAGNYKAVWRSIPERALMVAANNLKYLPEMRDLAIKLLKNLSNEALEATAENMELEESIDDLEDHEENVRRMRDLPSSEDINEMIRAIEIAIPQEDKFKKNKSLININ